MRDSVVRLHRSGFTLLELLISITVIGILAAIVVLAVNPQAQLRNAKDVKRLADMNAILKAVNQFQIATGRLPQLNGVEAVLIHSSPSSKEICRYDSSQISFATLCDIFGFRYIGEIAPGFIAKLPTDPEHDPADTWGTDYHIWKDANGRITVSAPLYNGGEGIELKL
jgi:prepilin-type N-terminal cleavage/methylation domain-containing protein